MMEVKVDERFRLVQPAKRHEKEAIAYIMNIRASKAGVHGVGGLDRYLDDYDGWLKKLAEDRERKFDPKADLVPAETYFLVRKTATYVHPDKTSTTKSIVGMINIRLGLNDRLWEYGGHIGYSILSSERRKGYNKINLFLGLCVCQQRGIEAVLLDCDKDNLGSSKTMRAMGAKLLRRDGDTERYVIDVDRAVGDHSVEMLLKIEHWPE